MNNLKIYLTEAYAIDNKSILRILTQNKQINKSDPEYNYYEKLANWANSGGKQQKLKNIDLNAIKLSDKGLIEKRKLTTRYSTLGHLLLALKNLMDQEGKYTPSSELSRLIQITTSDILTALSGIKDNQKLPEEPDDTEDDADEEDDGEEPTDDEDDDNSEPEPVETSNGKRDWTAERAKRLANANGNTSDVLNKFYEDYYSIEYANGDTSIVAKLKSLDKILVQEFNALGYNPEVNPFAQFLKILIEKKPEIFNKLNTNNYGAIHNSFIARSITGNMLGNYNTDNLLFCNDLYNHNGLDIVEYLSLQKQVKDKAKNAAKYSDISRFTARVFIQQKTFNNNYEENIKQLLKAKENDITPIIEKESKLKSLLEVRELYKHLFKSTAKKQVDIDEIVAKTKPKKMLLDIIQHIIDQDEYEYALGALVSATKEWLKERKYIRTDIGIEAGKKILSEYNVNGYIAKTLIPKLQAAYIKSINNKKAENN
jgi:hypothetical protein